MTDTALHTRSLQSEYEARLAADLDQNSKAHERVTLQMTVLAQQLKMLEQDRALLLSVQQAVGTGRNKAADSPEALDDVVEEKEAGKRKPAASREAGANVPAARKANGSKASKTAKTAKSRTSSDLAKLAKTGRRGTSDSKAPSLVQLVRDHLAEWNEPRSAVEVAKAVSGQHPDRGVNVNGVRMALESLVAKAVVQRSQQGRAVFYERVPEPGAGTTPTIDSGPAQPAVR